MKIYMDVIKNKIYVGILNVKFKILVIFESCIWEGGKWDWGYIRNFNFVCNVLIFENKFKENMVIR